MVEIKKTSGRNISRARNDWNDFVKQYTSNDFYWYVPKGRCVRNIKDILILLRFLEKFESYNWHDVQHEYLMVLKDKGSFHARAHGQSQSDVNAMARMLKKVFDFLGIARVNESDLVPLQLK